MMELTKNVIKSCDKDILDLDDYFIVIKEIEDNINANNDITVEACKALIEGILLKSLSLLDANFKGKRQNKLKGDFKLLKIEAFNTLFKNDEAKLLITPLIDQITEVPRINNLIIKSIVKSKSLITDSVSGLVRFRNDKGDISHGKIYPKEILPKHLVKSIVSITDAVCSYLIIELSNKYKIELEKDPLSDYRKNSFYNEWLNLTYGENFPIAKASYSRVLFDNDFDLYKVIFNNEYPLNKTILESTDDEKLMLGDLIFSIENYLLEMNNKYDALNKKMPVNRVQVDEVQVDEVQVNEVQVDEVQVNEVQVDEVQVNEVPVNEIQVDEVQVNEVNINTLLNIKKLIHFSRENNLDIKKLKPLIDDKISINKEPLRDEILAVSITNYVHLVF